MQFLVIAYCLFNGMLNKVYEITSTLPVKVNLILLVIGLNWLENAHFNRNITGCPAYSSTEMK